MVKDTERLKITLEKSVINMLNLFCKNNNITKSQLIKNCLIPIISPKAQIKADMNRMHEELIKRENMLDNKEDILLFTLSDSAKKVLDSAKDVICRDPSKFEFWLKKFSETVGKTIDKETFYELLKLNEFF